MSVYKDSQNNGTWMFQKVVVNESTGEKKRLRQRGFDSKRSAEAAEILAVSDFVKMTSKNVLLFDEVIKEYLNYKALRIKARSLIKINRLLDKFVTNQLQNKNMISYSQKDVNDFIDNLIKFSDSANYRNKVIALLKSIFHFAEVQYNLNNNPTKIIKGFKENKEKKNYNVYTFEEFTEFISTFSEATAYEYSYKVFFSVLYWAGLRRGECKALKWNDVSFEENTIRVDEQFIDKDPVEGRVCTELKTESSYRTVVVDSSTMCMIRALFEVKSKNKHISADDFIFTRMDSYMPFADTTIELRNKRHAKRANLKRIRVHDFRHSFASLNYSLDIDPKTISVQMGHSSLTITLDTYVNMFDDKLKDRANKIEELKKGKRKK